MAGVEVGTAYLTILPSAEGFGAKLQGQIAPDMAAAGDKAGDEAGKRLGAKFSSRVRSAAKTGAAILAGGVLAASAWGAGAVAEARESQKVGAVTAQVIAATGGAAQVTADQVGDLATAISNKTGIDDEAIQSGSNLLLTFKNVKNEAGSGANIFDRATAAAVDLASTGFGSITGNSKMLGKALNDPVKGLAALGKAGVTFTQSQKDQIAAMVEAGDVLGAQKIIMKELESQVGGTAEASATAGEKMSTAYGNLKEQVGTALLPLIDSAESAITSKIIPAVSGFIAGIQSGEGAGGQFADRCRDIWQALEKTGGFIRDNQAWLAPLVGTVLAAAAGWKAWTLATAAWSAVTKGAAAAQALLNTALVANPIGIVVAAVAGLAAGLVIAYKRSETFRNIVNTAFLVVKIAALQLASVAVGAFQFLLKVWLEVAAGIVKSAAKAFGWVPGLGPKLQRASDEVESFKDRANASIARVKDRLDIQLETAKAELAARGLSSRLNAILKDRMMHATLTGTVVVNGVHYNAGQFATGGLVRGPGTSTSDSILARLSDKEYVVRAAAVDHYGVGFLDRLNARKLRDGGTAAGRTDPRPVGAQQTGPTVVQLTVDRRVLAEVVLDELGSRRGFE